jgi:hypothetical protein
VADVEEAKKRQEAFLVQHTWKVKENQIQRNKTHGNQTG